MKKIAALLLPVVLSLSSSGAIVEWGAGISNGLSGSAGGNLADDNFVRVGAFNISDGVIAQNAGNIPFLFANFIEFGRARIGDNLGNINGHFASTSQGNTGSTGLNLVGRQIYLWAFSASDNTTADSSLATAIEHGIFYVEIATDPDWAFPVEEPVPQNTTIDLSDLTQTGNAGALRPGSHVVVGNFPVGTSTTTSAANFGLAIPEPSSAALVSIGALILARRRKTK